MKFTKEFVLGLFESKKTEPEKVDEFLNGLTDKEHIELMEVIKSLANDIPTEYHNDELRKNLAVLDKNIAILEEGIVDAEIKEMMDDVELDALAKQRHIAYMDLKNEVRRKLLENPASPEAKSIANLIIKTEKEHKNYNEAEWTEVLHLLGPENVPAAPKPIVEETPPIEEIKKDVKSPYDRPPLTRNQIFLKLDKIKFKADELEHFMSTKGTTREEFCIAVPMLFSMYEGTKQYKTNKQFREEIIKQKKIQYEIVADYTEIFKRQKEREEAEKAAKEKGAEAVEEITDKLKDQLMLEPNNESIKKMIRDIIALQKEFHIYDEDYWEDILHLL